MIGLLLIGHIILNGGDVFEMCCCEIVEALAMPAPQESKISDGGVVHSSNIVLPTSRRFVTSKHTMYNPQYYVF